MQQQDRRASGGRFVRLLSFGAATIMLTAASCDDPLTKIHPGPVRFRVSIGKNLTQSNGFSANPSITADGRYVVFASDAKNLALPSSGFREIFMRDRVTDTVRNVTRLANVLDQTTIGDCDFPYISPNGDWVVFLARGDMTQTGFPWPPAGVPSNPFPYSIIRWDRVNDAFNLVLYWPDADCSNPTISNDGRWISFLTRATNIGVNTGSNDMVVVADANNGFATTLISRSMGTTNPCDQFCQAPTISADGSLIVFCTYASDLTSDSFPANKQMIFAGAPDGSSMQLVSRDSLGAVADNHCVTPNISGDGRYVCFVYGGGTLIPGIAPSVAQVIRRDLISGTSINAGINPVALQIFSNIVSIGTGISDDGRFVAAWYPIFDGTGNFVDLTVGVQEVQGRFFDASVGIIGNTGASLNQLPIMSLSADGSTVVFMSLSDAQVVGDTNAVMDVIGFGPMR